MLPAVHVWERCQRHSGEWLVSMVGATVVPVPAAQPRSGVSTSPTQHHQAWPPGHRASRCGSKNNKIKNNAKETGAVSGPSLQGPGSPEPREVRVDAQVGPVHLDAPAVDLQEHPRGWHVLG